MELMIYQPVKRRRKLTEKTTAKVSNIKTATTKSAQSIFRGGSRKQCLNTDKNASNNGGERLKKRY